MGRTIPPSRPDPGPEPETEVVEISREQLGRWVRESIARNRTARRTTKCQEALDRAVEVLHEEGELSLAAGALILMAARVAGRETVALQALMQFLADVGQAGGLDQRCRACGCTQQLGRPGGRQWVEFDLCGACDRELREASRAAHRDSTRPGQGRDGH